MASFFTLGISTFPKDPVTGETNWPLNILTGYLCECSLPTHINLDSYLTSRYINSRFNSADYKRFEHGAFDQDL